MTDRDPISSSLAPAPYISRPASGSSLAQNTQNTPNGPKTWQDGDTTSFRDVLAIINPLQHLPVVGTLYRAITGDTISTMPSLIGGAIFGGPIGFISSLASNAFKAGTGMDPGESVIASIFGSKTPEAPAGAPPSQQTAQAPRPQPQFQTRSPDEPTGASSGPAPRPLVAPDLLLTAQAPSQVAQYRSPDGLSETSAPWSRQSGTPNELTAKAPATPATPATPESAAKVPPTLVYDIPQPQWAKDAAAKAQPASAAKGAPGSAAKVAPPLVIDIPHPQSAKDAAAAQTASAPKAGLPLNFQSPTPLSTRFRSSDLPQPVGEGGGLATHTGGDLVPTANGAAIARDAVPAQMMSALDKYGAMMRARNATATPTQVSVLR